MGAARPGRLTRAPAPAADSGAGEPAGAVASTGPDPADPGADEPRADVREARVPAAPSDLRGYDTVFAYVDGPLSEDGLYGPLVGLSRAVPDGADALSHALSELLAGPTEPEDAAGLVTWFSGRTAGMLRSVTLEDGFAVVDFRDFRPIIPNAGSSAGSMMLMRHLEATAFQFPEVRRVEFRIDGDCEELMAWLQIGCIAIRRSSFDAPDGFRLAVPGPR